MGRPFAPVFHLIAHLCLPSTCTSEALVTLGFTNVTLPATAYESGGVYWPWWFGAVFSPRHVRTSDFLP